MANETNISGLGLVFFQADGNVGGFVRHAGEQHQLTGGFEDGAVVLSGPAFRLTYSRVEQPSERHPVGRGELVDLRDGTVTPVAVFANKLADGRRVHGISVAGSSAKVVDAPF